MFWHLEATFLLATLTCVLGGPISAAQDRCQCVPDQWEGLLSSFDREFDLRGGRSAASDSNLYIHYDYKNRLFAMTDVNTGSTSLADYSKVSVT